MPREGRGFAMLGFFRKGNGEDEMFSVRWGEEGSA